MKLLDKYFKSIKEHPELMDTNELNELLDLGTLNVEKARSKKFYLRTAASVLLVVSISLLGWYSLKSPETEIVEVSRSKNFATLVRHLKTGSNNSSNMGLHANPIKNIPEEFTSYLMPNKKALLQLGITLGDDYINYEGNVDLRGYVKFRIDSETHSVTVDDNRLNIPTYDFYPMFLSDLEGRRRVNYSFGSESMILEDSIFKRMTKDMVPILVKIPGVSDTVVFWYSPSPTLFKILDENIGIPVTKEGLSDENGLETEEFQRFLISPNPASNIAYVEVEFMDERVSINIVDMNGTVIGEIISNSLKSGVERVQFDVSSIKPGIYLVVLDSDKRGRSVQRIIINR